MEDKHSAFRPVGVFDSGVGGIAVLQCARQLMANEKFIYYGDIGNAPYGEKEKSQVLSLVENAAARLDTMGIKALLVACNTATAIGVEHLRSRYVYPIVAMEPAVKPACLGRSGARIGVIATPATLAMPKYLDLTNHIANGNEIISLPCPGLSRLIETEGPGSAAVTDYLSGLFASSCRLDALVIGCTHYSFIKKDIRRILHGIDIYDGAEGTARQLLAMLKAQGICAPADAEGDVEFMSTQNDPEDLALFRRFLSLPTEG